MKKTSDVLRSPFANARVSVGEMALLGVCLVVGFAIWGIWFALNYPRPAILEATLSQNHKAVHSLLEQGSDVNTADDDGRTILMFAAVKKDRALVQEFLRRGADANRRDGHGRTALTWARYGDDAEIIKILKKANSNAE